MNITDLFSKRQKRNKGEIPDVFIYDEIPNKLRVQIVHIIRDAFGEDKSYNGSKLEEVYEFVNQVVSREYGKFSLGEDYQTHESQVLNFLLESKVTEEVIDVIEVSFKYIDRAIRNNFATYTYNFNLRLIPDEAIAELNQRFRENGVGYSFDAGEIIRVDSTIIHQEITKPTISLLWNPKFQGANEEYLKALEHYRHNRNKECLTECLKAFESTMKIICKEKGWAYQETDTAKKLIQICFTNSLVPSFVQNQFTSLQNLFESGIPTLRNKLGGHGQGPIPQKVDDGITRYGLNLTGTNIIFLIEQSGI